MYISGVVTWAQARWCHLAAGRKGAWSITPIGPCRHGTCKTVVAHIRQSWHM